MDMWHQSEKMGTGWFDFTRIQDLESHKQWSSWFKKGRISLDIQSPSITTLFVKSLSENDQRRFVEFKTIL
jgi:hypothetical protein